MISTAVVAREKANYTLQNSSQLPENDVLAFKVEFSRKEMSES